MARRYRFAEICYRRESTSTSSSSGAVNTSKAAATLERVVLFFPDVWRCMPTRQEWADLEQRLHTSSGSSSEDAGDTLPQALGIPLLAPKPRWVPPLLPQLPFPQAHYCMNGVARLPLRLPPQLSPASFDSPTRPLCQSCIATSEQERASCCQFDSAVPVSGSLKSLQERTGLCPRCHCPFMLCAISLFFS